MESGLDPRTGRIIDRYAIRRRPARPAAAAGGQPGFEVREVAELVTVNGVQARVYVILYYIYIYVYIFYVLHCVYCRTCVMYVSSSSPACLRAHTSAHTLYI